MKRNRSYRRRSTRKKSKKSFRKRSTISASKKKSVGAKTKWRIGKKFEPNNVRYVHVDRKRSCPPGFTRTRIGNNQFTCSKSGGYFAVKVRN